MADCIAYQDTNYFSSFMTDYLAQKESLTDFYEHFPKLENFKKQVDLKQENYSVSTRKVLVSSLREQYKDTQISAKSQENIELLTQENTFTITTGHQLNLFTGPLYFLYKIISTINLTEELKERYPGQNFVPIYWMATEDHDFEEINFFNFEQHKIQWNKEASGAVGDLPTEGLEEVFKKFSILLNDSEQSAHLKSLFKKAYLEHHNLTEATRYLANELFGIYGLIILDGNDAALKKELSPYVKNELLHQISSEEVGETSKKINELGYKIQVNPREINLFYLKENLRERIIKEDEYYIVHETNIRFTEEEIITELDNYPERFSPNVIMRPLYEEVVLPNLCYIGGGGELAYWMQLKSYFRKEKVSFPILLLRNSALLMSEKQIQKTKKLGLSFKDLFLKQENLISKRTKEISAIEIDFSAQKEQLQQQFKDMYALAQQTDKSFYGAVAAQEKKQLNGLDHLEKRLLKAQKRKLKDELQRVVHIQDEVFPHQSLQERSINFSEFYQTYGQDLIPKLKKELKPLDLQFSIISLTE
ncbi:bacillithiol biosynthesis cysteine-adding enzyme BshC [Mesonia sp. MT50]|uniref:Putative cysteine ligase BshC n=1 Tax=Mesonia profundi TaxID=3070998 RepID=A0ABU0ZZE6_9FLAO|nr:bacillithiol biosynthesis cysteine-adding enzyme BshC [Mesonia profundi]MDQ7916835.1 bacillithiol biosynthesis cysteine-adding enzyme BshC [Mesonia profundi]